MHGHKLLFKGNLVFKRSPYSHSSKFAVAPKYVPFQRGTLCALHLCSLERRQRTMLTGERCFINIPKSGPLECWAGHVRKWWLTDPSRKVFLGAYRSEARESGGRSQENEQKGEKWERTEWWLQMSVWKTSQKLTKPFCFQFRNRCSRRLAFEMGPESDSLERIPSERMHDYIRCVIAKEKNSFQKQKCVCKGERVKRPIDIFMSSTFAFIFVTDAQYNKPSSKAFLCFQII